MARKKILSKDTEKPIYFSDICEIRLKLPSLNEYVNVSRRNAYESASFKRGIERKISRFLTLKRFENPVFIIFTWYEANNRRDVDNITFAKKFILDAMIKQGILKDDSRKYVKQCIDFVKTGKENKVIVEVIEYDERRIEEYYRSLRQRISNYDGT